MWCRDQCLCYHTKSFHFNNSSQDLTSAYLHIILDISSVLCRLTIDMDYWLWPGLLQVGTTTHSVPALVWRNKTSDSMLQHHNSQTCKQCLTMLKCESIQYCLTVKIYAECGQMSHFDRFRKCQSTMGHFQLWESAWNDFSEHCTFHSKYCKTLLPYLTTALCADLVWPPERDLVQFPHPPLRRPSNYQTITERRRRWENSPHRGSHVHSSRARPWWR